MLKTRWLYGIVAVSVLLSSVLTGAPPEPAYAEGPNAVQGPPDLTGCTTSTLAANDDGSAGPVNLGFTINFFGVTQTQTFVNNNGNVTFGSLLGDFTPPSLASSGKVIVAPFFADVDTAGPGSGVVTYGAGTYQGRSSFCANWLNVGYYDDATNKLNSFQLILVSRADRGVGDFDIVFNYDKVQWETGGASGGKNGLGGQPARAGYSNGTVGGSFELPGSGTPGSFLNGGPQALISGSRSSGGQQGRYRFEVTNGAPPSGGTINGTVFQEGSPQTTVANSLVSACNVVLVPARCQSSFSGPTGQYSITGLADDNSWGLVAFPPANSPLFAVEKYGYQIVGGQLQLVAGQNTNLTLTVPRAPRQGVSVTPALNPGSIGATVWSSLLPLTLTTTGPAGCIVTYELSQGGVVFMSGGTTEAPPGTYKATVGPLNPRHGPMTVKFIWDCPGPNDPPPDFIDGYLDPSGTVKTPAGVPIQGATVTLLRSDSFGGPFTAVPNGSVIMSPSNRVNPDLTNAEGMFHWDVLAGFYKVRAEKAGCVSPTNPGQAFVETVVLEVPPPRFDLDLRLNCTGAPTPTSTPTVPTPTVGPGSIGGRGLTITRSGPGQAKLDWLFGTSQTGYQIIRYIPPSTFGFPPAGVPIAGNLTTFTESNLAPGPTCYILLPVGGNPPSTNAVQGLTDLVCLYVGSGSGLGATQFSLRLSAGTTANLNWANPATTFTHSFLIATTFDGAAPRVRVLQGSPTSAVDATNGLTTCYTLVTANGPELKGYTDAICVAPLSTIGTAALPAGFTVSDATTRIQQAVQRQGVKP